MPSKIDYAAIVWLRCPKCPELFYLETSFFRPEYADVKVMCPYCHLEFPKEDSPQMWKPPGLA